MKFVDEYRDPRLAERLLGLIRQSMTRPWTIMEVCGGQTHTLIRSGIGSAGARELRLGHGAGWPGGGTAVGEVGRGVAGGGRAGGTFLPVGGMVRGAGTAGDLPRVRAEGGDVR